MPSTYTTRNGLELQGPGENTNAWGTILNNRVFQLVDALADGVASYAVNGTKTLTGTVGAANEARMRVQIVSGGTGGTIIIPSVEKNYFFQNKGTGDVIVSTGAGASATVKVGGLSHVYCDGANVYTLDPTHSFVAPTSPYHIANKTYVDGAIITASLGSNIPTQTGKTGPLFTNGTVADFRPIVTSDVQGALDPGEIIRLFGAALRTDLLPCDGSFVSRTGFPDLYAAMFAGKAWAGFRRTAPASLPAAAGTTAYPDALAWSPDGSKLAMGIASSPYLELYSWNSGTPLKLAAPAVAPTGQVRGIAWSPDSRYMAIVQAASTYLLIYDWQTGSPVKIADPASGIGANGYAIDWRADGRYMVVAEDDGNKLSIYDWQTGSPVKTAAPGTPPTFGCRGVSWSPNGRWMVMGMNASPFVWIYDWQTGTPVKITNPVSLPAGAIVSGTWSADSRYVVLTASGVWPIIYDMNTGLAVAVSFPAVAGITPRSAAFSNDGTLLAVAGDGGLVMFTWAAGVATRVDDPNEAIPNAVCTGFRTTDNVIAVTCTGSPFLAIYQALTSTITTFPVPVISTTYPPTYIKALP